MIELAVYIVAIYIIGCAIYAIGSLLLALILFCAFEPKHPSPPPQPKRVRVGKELADYTFHKRFFICLAILLPIVGICENLSLH